MKPLSWGAPHPQLGQAIVAVVTGDAQSKRLEKDILNLLKQQLPVYMIPRQICIRKALPCNVNGKFDRRQLLTELGNTFQPCPGKP